LPGSSHGAEFARSTLLLIRGGGKHQQLTSIRNSILGIVLKGRPGDTMLN